jgi:hypothetical protein
MNGIVTVTTNILYTKDSEGNFNKQNELVFVLDETNYEVTKSGNVERTKQLKDIRFVVSEKGFDKLIEVLQKLRDAKEEDLQ